MSDLFDNGIVHLRTGYAGLYQLHDRVSSTEVPSTSCTSTRYNHPPSLVRDRYSTTTNCRGESSGTKPPTNVPKGISSRDSHVDIFKFVCFGFIIIYSQSSGVVSSRIRDASHGNVIISFWSTFTPLSPNKLAFS